MANAASAAETVDHSQSVANMDEFNTGLDPVAVETINTAIYFSGSVDNGLDDLDLDFEVNDRVEERYSQMLTDDVADVLSRQGIEFDDLGIEELDLEDLEAATEEYSFDNEELETVVELDSKIGNIADASNVETKILEGHVACTAVAACVAVAAVAGAVVAATVNVAVNVNVFTGSY